MIKVKPHLENIERTDPDKNCRKGFLRLDMNEGIPGMPVDLIREVMGQINQEFLSMYPEYRSIKGKIATHNNISPENICLSNGSDAAIKYIFDAYVSAGDKILVTDPTFAMYPVYCSMFDAELIIEPYKRDLSFPINEFSGRISKDIKVAIVVNPNNPTGSVIKKEDLLKLIEKASENEVLMIVDEAYFYFYPETVIEKIKEFRNLIVLRTFSKLCGLAAARLGYSAACPQIIQNLYKVRPTYDVNSLGILFAEYLLDRPHVIKDLVKQVMEGKQFLAKCLFDEGIEYYEGGANFILIKCAGRVTEIMKRLYENNILVAGGFKQVFLKDYIRVSVGEKIYMQKFWDFFIKIIRRKN